MEKQIEILLSQVAEIVQQDNAQRERNGDNFNIFDILNIQTNEIKHSAFIAELLNPKGRHGFGDIFLQAFINSIDCLKDWNFDTYNAIVKTEHNIGQTNESYTQGGAIDILVKSQDKAIIIENKINAPDRKNQLIRYYNYAKKLDKTKKSNHRIIYLTIDGNEASEYSTKDQLKAGKDYYTISYSSEILEWLNICESKSSCNLTISNAITQYIRTIKNLVNQDMLPENRENIIEIMSRPENVSAVLAIQNHLRDWTFQIVKKYLIPQLQEWAESNNLKFEQWGFLDNQDGFGFYFYKEEWTRSAIWIYTDNKKRLQDFYIDIYSTDGKSLKGLCNQHLIFENDGNMKADIYRPYGGAYLDEYRNWSIENIFEGNVGKYIIKKVKATLEKIDQFSIKMP